MKFWSGALQAEISVEQQTRAIHIRMASGACRAFLS